MRKTLVFFAAFLLVTSFGYAQEISIAPVVGPSFTFGLTASGLKKESNEALRELREDNPDVKYRSIQSATPGFLLGGLADYMFNESLALQSGLLFHLRGRNRALSSKGTDWMGEAINNKISYDYRISYLEIPLWINYKLGESGFKLVGGPNFGFAVSAKLKGKGKGISSSISESAKVSIGSDAFNNVVKPFDVSLNLGIGKDFEIGNNPLELTLFIQPSLSAGNTA